MNRLLRVFLGFVLYFSYSILPAYAEISNHQIFYRQDKRAPLTRIDIIFLGAGSNQESPAQIGLARTVSKLIWEAAKKQGRIDQLAVLGTELYVFANTTSLTVSVSTLSENCAESIEIVRDVIYNFAFFESDLEDVKKQEMTNYRNDMDRNTTDFMRNFALAKTRDIKKLRSLKTLKKFSVKDIRRYYVRLLKTEVVFFKALSDRDSTEIAKLLRPITDESKDRLRRQTDGFVDSLRSPPFKILSDRDSTEIAKLFRPIRRQADGFVHSLAQPITDHYSGPSAFVFENYSRLKSVFCRWLIPCGMIGEEDYLPSMISRALGRYGARGLLYKYFRKELGLVYSIGCSYESSGDVRFLEIYADPRLQNSEELIAKMSDLIRGLSDDPRFWEEIKELRENRNVAYAHVHERLTPQRRLYSDVYRAIYNPPIRKGGSKSVTDAEVRAFLEKFFVPENMIMIFVGPKDHIIDILNRHWPQVDIRVHNTKELIE
ncbi:MAG: insulinase family protein [Gemmatimonadetes bacterium]|nr:insulinase family protein [Gemmatimonadota bacterium]MYK53359.1 insulinase family protein [Gemmatimonadota bacterium]